MYRYAVYRWADTINCKEYQVILLQATSNYFSIWVW